MEPITIYLILSLIINLILFQLYRVQKRLEQLHEQIIKKQEKLIQLLKRVDEIKKPTE